MLRFTSFWSTQACTTPVVVANPPKRFVSRAGFGAGIIAADMGVTLLLRGVVNEFPPVSSSGRVVRWEGVVERESPRRDGSGEMER
jgi:hypothetical protein